MCLDFYCSSLYKAVGKFPSRIQRKILGETRFSLSQKENNFRKINKKNKKNFLDTEDNLLDFILDSFLICKCFFLCLSVLLSFSVMSEDNPTNMKRHSEGTFSNDYSKYLETRRAQDFIQWLMNSKRSGYVLFSLSIVQGNEYHFTTG